MNDSQPNQTPLVFDELLARCMGEIDFAHKILRDFLDSSLPLFEDIKTCWSESLMPEMTRIVHRLKGTAATVAAHPLFETLVCLEEILRVESQPTPCQVNQALEVSLERFSDVRDYIETRILAGS